MKLFPLYLIICFSIVSTLFGCSKVSFEGNTFWGDLHVTRWDLNYYFADKINYNEGVGGQTIEQLNSNLQNRQKQYTKSFVEIGTNDCLQYLNSNISEDTAFSVISTKYSELLITLANMSKECYILSLIPIGKPTDLTYINNLQMRLNDFLRTETCKYSNVKFINVFDDLVNNEGFINSSYTLDGVHLNKDGYDVIALSILKYV